MINKILNKLKSKDIDNEVKIIENLKLPKNIEKWVREYEKVGEREYFIWQWLYKMFPIIQIPVAQERHKESLLEMKILITMFVIQLDDAADKEQKWKLLQELLKIIRGDEIEIKKLSLKDQKYLLFTKKLWSYIDKEVRKYPYYKELKKILYYDLNQVINGMEYACLVNKNFYLINKTEYWLYLPHNMTFMVYLTVDLMCSNEKIIKKIGLIREIMWESQKIGRISNWVTTWQREIEDRDFTSGVFAYAIEKNVLDPDQLKTLSKNKIIDKIKKSNIEKDLLNELEISYNIIKYNKKRISPINIDNFISGLEYLLLVDLVSRGYK